MNCNNCNCPKCGTPHECETCIWVCHGCGRADCNSDGLMPVDVLVRTRILTNNLGGRNQHDNPDIEVAFVETRDSANFCADGGCYDHEAAERFLAEVEDRVREAHWTYVGNPEDEHET